MLPWVEEASCPPGVGLPHSPYTISALGEPGDLLLLTASALAGRGDPPSRPSLLGLPLPPSL